VRKITGRLCEIECYQESFYSPSTQLIFLHVYSVVLTVNKNSLVIVTHNRMHSMKVIECYVRLLLKIYDRVFIKNQLKTWRVLWANVAKKSSAQDSWHPSAGISGILNRQTQSIIIRVQEVIKSISWRRRTVEATVQSTLRYRGRGRVHFSFGGWKWPMVIHPGWWFHRCSESEAAKQR
jgi:hypothetical protein